MAPAFVEIPGVVDLEPRFPGQLDRMDRHAVRDHGAGDRPQACNTVSPDRLPSKWSTPCDTRDARKDGR